MSINKMHIWIELLCKEKEYAWKKRNDQIFSLSRVEIMGTLRERERDLFNKWKFMNSKKLYPVSKFNDMKNNETTCK